MTPLFARTAHFGTAGLRQAQAARLMQQRGLDGILLASPENVFYTTGYTTLPSAGNPILYTLRNRLPFFSYVDARGRRDAAVLGVRGRVGRVRCRSRDRLQRLRRSDGRAHAARGRSHCGSGETLGVESTCPYSVLQVLGEARGKDEPVVVVDDVINRLRLIKSPAEIALLERSIQIVEQSCRSSTRPCTSACRG